MKESLAGSAALAAMFTGLATAVRGQQTQPAKPGLQGFDPSSIRRVVTGHNAQGKSYIVSDERIPSVARGEAGFLYLWATEQAQQLGPGSADEPRKLLPTTSPSVDPAPGGTRAYIATLPPKYNGKATHENRAGFHRSETLDYVFVLSGEITMLMDISEVRLKAGDLVLQRNTDHSWRVESDVPVSLLAFIVRIDPIPAQA
jgi:hypothetical protein